MPVGKIQKIDRLNSQGFVAVSHAGRDEDFPWAKAANVQRVNGAKGLRIAPQVTQEKPEASRIPVPINRSAPSDSESP